MLPQSTPVVIIPLSQGKTATIDVADAPRVLFHKWRLKKDRTIHRAVASIGGQEVLLHRFILGPAPDMAVHFVNGDGLDCRRSNMVMRSRVDVARESGRRNKGERNGQWRGDAARATTKRNRAQRRYTLAGPCQVCGDAPATDRHHRDGDPGHNDPDNIVLCCRRCHMTLDGRLAGLRGSAPARGDDHPRNKLSAAQMDEVRQLLSAAQMCRAEIARLYGVSWNVINHVYRRTPQLRGQIRSGPAPEQRRRGERHPVARLTEAQVREIRRRYAAGNATFRGLAREFGVDACTITRVVRRTSWTHVE